MNEQRWAGEQKDPMPFKGQEPMNKKCYQIVKSNKES